MQRFADIVEKRKKIRLQLDSLIGLLAPQAVGRGESIVRREVGGGGKRKKGRKLD